MDGASASFLFPVRRLLPRRVPRLLCPSANRGVGGGLESAWAPGRWQSGGRTPPRLLGKKPHPREPDGARHPGPLWFCTLARGAVNGAFLTRVLPSAFPAPPSPQHTGEPLCSQLLAAVRFSVSLPAYINLQGSCRKPHVHRAEMKPDRGSSLQMTVSARVTCWTAAPMTSWLGRRQASRLVKIARQNAYRLVARMDLGECTKIHDLALRADYEIASKERDLFFELDAMDHLESFIAECDRRTELAKKRLAETQEEISAEVSAKAEKVHELNEEIGKLLAKAEQLGAEGNVDESQKILMEVEKVRAKKKEAEEEYRNSMPASSFQQQKLRVCEVCSAYLGLHDNDRRLADHFGGKLHLGFIQIREKLDQLRKTVAEKQEKRNQDRLRRREEREREERLSRRSGSRTRDRRRSRSRDRRRRRSRSTSRERRKLSRSRSRDRHRRHRSRSRSHSRGHRRASRDRSAKYK
ncbi:putative RNA-binding protein Luc7-like 1 isoform X2 [Callithrix jacchus]